MNPRAGLGIRVAIGLAYLTMAILLNSAGTVILQSINSLGVSKASASVLEAYKDLPIAAVSFLVASFLPRLGYRRGMMLGLAGVAIACAAMALTASFVATKLLFVAVGAAFAVIKVSIYSIVGLLTEDRSSHARFTNVIEGLFMVGVLAGYWLFSAFIAPEDPASLGWLHVYWVLLALVAGVVLLLALSPLDETGAVSLRAAPIEDFWAMLGLMARPLVLVFVLSAFLYVLIEQGIGTWLPTFNNQILSLPPAMSVQAASIFAVGLAVGRFGAAAAMTRFGWYPILNFCLAAMAVLVVVILPLTRDLVPAADLTWSTAPLAAFLFPMIGIFLAPIYPAIISAILSTLPRAEHAPMMGLIVVFSALGGTTGSLIAGQVFAAFDGRFAFYLSLVPMAGLTVSLFFFRRAIERIRPEAMRVAVGTAGH